MLLLAVLGLVLGGVGGGAAYVVVHLVGLISNLTLLHRVGFDLPDLRHYHPSPVLIPEAVGGAAVVVVLAKWSPIIKGHGIPESLEAILFRESRVAPRAALAKPVSAAVAMGTGGPFGAEGPIIVTGASIGSLLGQVLPVSPAERRILLATGAAAGMAGVFATPVAAVVLAFELLVFERSLRAVVPLVGATAVATALHHVLIGSRPLFPLAHDFTPAVGQLPLFVLLGLAAGVLAIVLNRGLFATESIFRRLPVPEWSHPLIGAVGFAAIGLAVPGSLSVGYWAITDAVNGRFTLVAVAMLFVAKMVSWWIGLGSNTSGGTLAPMFLVGASMGEMLGIGFAHAFPGAHIHPGAFALVGMGVTFGVGARALLTGVVFAAEVTGGYGLIVPLLIAAVFAELVAEAGLRERIMTEKLVRRGYRVELDCQVDALHTRVAGQVMSATEGPDVRSRGRGSEPDHDGTLPSPPAVSEPTAGGTVRIDRWAYAAEALPALLGAGCDEVAVTDRGRVVGRLDRAALGALVQQRVSDEQVQAPSLRFRRRRAPGAPEPGGEERSALDRDQADVAGQLEGG